MLTVEPTPITGVGDGIGQAAQPRIHPLPCPLRAACPLSIEWPRGGDADVILMDVAGRRIRALFRGHVSAGPQMLSLDPGGLANGVYFVRARLSSAAAQLRIALVK